MRRRATTAHAPFGTVLVPTDFSGGSAAALDRALALRRTTVRAGDALVARPTRFSFEPP
jgi:hypothetical protein